MFSAWHIDAQHFIKHVVFSNTPIMFSIGRNRDRLLLGPDKFLFKEIDDIGCETLKHTTLTRFNLLPLTFNRSTFNHASCWRSGGFQFSAR